MITGVIGYVTGTKLDITADGEEEVELTIRILDSVKNGIKFSKIIEELRLGKVVISIKKGW